MEAFRQSLDLALRNKNTYYNDLITGNILQTLVISRLRKDSFWNMQNHRVSWGTE